MQPVARPAKKRLTLRSSSEWKEIAAIRPPMRSVSHAIGSAASIASSSPLTAILSAWNVLRAGWPLPKRAAVGIPALIASTRPEVDSSGRRRTISRAIPPEKRSSPSVRRIREIRSSGQVLTISAAVSSCRGSILMSRGASCE